MSCYHQVASIMYKKNLCPSVCQRIWSFRLVKSGLSWTKWPERSWNRTAISLASSSCRWVGQLIPTLNMRTNLFSEPAEEGDIWGDSRTSPSEILNLFFSFQWASQWAPPSEKPNFLPLKDIYDLNIKYNMIIWYIAGRQLKSFYADCFFRQMWSLWWSQGIIFRFDTLLHHQHHHHHPHHQHHHHRHICPF